MRAVWGFLPGSALARALSWLGITEPRYVALKGRLGFKKECGCKWREQWLNSTYQRYIGYVRNWFCACAGPAAPPPAPSVGCGKPQTAMDIVRKQRQLAAIEQRRDEIERAYYQRLKS